MQQHRQTGELAPRAPTTRIGVRNRIVTAAVAMSMLLAMIVALPAAPAFAATSDLDIQAISARDEPRAFGGAGVQQGDPIPEFRYLINVDNTGTTELRTPTGVCSPLDADYPNDCPWPSIAEAPNPSPIFTQGDQDDFPLLNLPDGRYLISVLADGYKIDGAHFTMPLQDENPIVVELQPNPLPDSTIRAQVFADITPTNGTQDPGDPGLPGFVGHIADVLGEVQTDVYGNPLCTIYEGEDPVTHEIPLASLDPDMVPIVETMGGNCVSDADGLLTIPHVGSNRYALSATPPDGQTWIQTSTLEGNHDFDAWVMEGATGYDTEFVLAGEQVPQPIFGFVPPMDDLPAGGTGSIEGVVVGVNTYTPPKGGSFDFWGGNTGTKIDHPIDQPWIALADLQAGDAAVWVGRGSADGSFTIPNVPPGNYSLSWWDEPQNYNLNWINVTVNPNQTVDMGNIPLNGWWTRYEGYVFEDLNRNGVKNPGEPGVPNFTLTMRRRDNTLMDRGQTTVSTDSTGHYLFESAYPLGEWTVMEAYSDSFYTTGVTYQSDNQPTPTTVKGAGVDVSVLSIIGLGGRMDWGVHHYDPTGANGIDPQNGGIVGTVSYGTTRNELDPQYLAAEDWQPGVAEVPVNLYAPVTCGTTTAPCDPTDSYELAPDGSYAKGALLNTYVTEHWGRPTGCTARDVDGNPLLHGIDENVLATDQEGDDECISSFMQGVQFGPYPTDQGTPDANFGAAVDGNYGFGDGCFLGDGTPGAFDPNTGACSSGDLEALPAGDYLVEIEIPEDVQGRPLYDVTSEEDINIGNGDQIVPQVPPPACAGALHTVNLAGDGSDAYPATVGDGTNGLPIGVTVPASTLDDAVDNPTFLDIGGSPYEGTPKPRCDTKLVGLNNGKSIVPIFEVFTDVPIPSRLRGLVVDDINFSTDPRSTMYGEKAGVPYVPVGIYDFNNRLVTTLESDFNGIYEVLLPSTNHISCPTPSGVCANMYRFVANDPGIPGALNPNFDPRYRTIATEFEALPGVNIPTDLAPTQVGVNVESPTTGLPQRVTCDLSSATPQLFAVSQPYVNGSGSFTINGSGFGATKGSGLVRLDTTTLPTTTWNDTTIVATVPAGTPVGPHQLAITANNGQSNVNGLTFHVRGPGYNPAVQEVGPGRTFSTIQAGLDAAFTNNGNDIVVVYPGTPDLANPLNNPRGAYYENLIMASPVKLQGVGPGGFQGNVFVPGSIIDAGAFGGDTDLATAWYDKLGTLTWDGNQDINDGEAVYVIASQNATTASDEARQFTSGFRASIDGFDIRGGNQRGFPGNFNDLTGGQTGLPPTVVTQGGAIFANAYARYLQITNNVVQNNGGAYGTIRIGTPDLPAPDTDQNNENIRIANNRIISNAGTNLAGGVGLFAGSDNYEVTRNDICANFSLEYGAGVSVYGSSPNGRIHHNRVYFNHANDEGGGIMIAGQLPTTAGELSPGSGPVDIYANQIQANLANDDGGGIRFLMAGNFPMNVYDNMIVNNVSTHEGGGVSLDDAPNVRVFNNTIMKNLTTATAVTSDGTPAPAGLSTSANSDELQVTLPAGSPLFSNPLLFNNIFWDNRAGTRAGTTVTGLTAGDADHWDLGVAYAPGSLAPTNSIVQQDAGVHPYTTSPTNSASNPAVVNAYDVGVSFATWRQNPAFVDATLVTVEAPANLLGDYHLSACPGTPACNLGAASKAVPSYQQPPATLAAPALDFDDQSRPALGGFDSGADEFGATVAPPTPALDLTFSTAGNSNPPGVGGTSDDADIYTWNGSAFSRVFDATGAGVPTGANVDGYDRVDATHFYLSFSGDTTIDVPDSPDLAVQDEDIVYYGAGAWSVFFDGTAAGLTTDAQDVDEFSIVGTTLFFSTAGSTNPPGVVGTADDADIFAWNGSAFSRVFDATAAGGIPDTANVDGLQQVDATHFYLSFSGATTTVTGLGTVQDEDVVYYDAGVWSIAFDGTAPGLTSDNLDLDAIAIGSVAPPPPINLTFSTTGNTNPPGVGGAADDADLYNWNGVLFGRQFDATGAGVPPGANVDGYDQVDATHFYVSFSGNTVIDVPGPVDLSVQDEDVVYYDAGAWSVFFDGTGAGLTADAQDIDEFSIVGTTLFFSTAGSTNPPGVGGTADDADIYTWNGSAFSRVFDATGAGVPAGANVDGLQQVNPTHFYLSFSGTTTIALTGPDLTVQDEDVVFFNAGTWSVAFDGTAEGLTDGNQDLDAIALGAPAPPPPPPPPAPNVYFSTTGNTSPPGVGGTADDADIYLWNGTAFSRATDVTAIANPLPTGANVDGYDRVDATHFYLSFAGATVVPGLGTVQDEDVVFYNAGTWSVYFDGTAFGLTADGQDLDEVSVDGTTLYFTTVGNINPPGVGGTADNADVYSWNGTSFSRVFDATAAGIPAAANVDGLHRVDATHYYLSFAGLSTFVTGLGAVQDEDVVYLNAGTWSVAFDGTAVGLTTDAEDLDAIDVG